MRIEIAPTGTGTAIALRDPDDFKSFSVLVRGEDPAREALASLGRASDDDHVYVDPQVLRRLAGERAEDPRWRASLEGMIGFAAEHGWVDAAGFVRAHVERAGLAP